MGDFFTKPPQGSKFRRFRSVILGKSRVNEPSPPRSMFDPKDDIIAFIIGGISKLIGYLHPHA